MVCTTHLSCKRASSHSTLESSEYWYTNERQWTMTLVAGGGEVFDRPSSAAAAAAAGDGVDPTASRAWTPFYWGPQGYIIGPPWFGAGKVSGDWSVAVSRSGRFNAFNLCCSLVMTRVCAAAHIKTNRIDGRMNLLLLPSVRCPSSEYK